LNGTHLASSHTKKQRKITTLGHTSERVITDGNGSDSLEIGETFDSDLLHLAHTLAEVSVLSTHAADPCLLSSDISCLQSMYPL
jgi:hypothetical protein